MAAASSHRPHVHPPIHRPPKPKSNRLSAFPLSCFPRGNLTPGIQSSAPPPPPSPPPSPMAELVGAFNELASRMGGALSTRSSSNLLFKALKLSIPHLQALPFAPDGRNRLTRALSVACLLADLQMDAEVISAGILREAMEAGTITMNSVKAHISIGTAHLLHENLRVRHIPSKIEIMDDESASALRKFCLTYYDIRAVVLELALKLDMMRHLDYLPRYHQQIRSLEVLKIYAPLSHAVGAGAWSLELEDLSFRYLFPFSYLYIETWLRSHGMEKSKLLIDVFKEQLRQALEFDTELEEMVEKITVLGRYKSRFSTMKKLLRDGRKPEEVNDLLGLRVILHPKPGENATERGNKACYRTYEVIRTMWKEVGSRTKDYISRPKANGYRSLHVAVDVSGLGSAIPLMEIQIRTTEMDVLAAGGAAAHSLYKAGLTDPEEIGTTEMDVLAAGGAAAHSLYKAELTDPEEAKRLKGIMMAAAELAALRLRDLPSANQSQGFTIIDKTSQVFRLLDKNGDGRISIEELTEVMEDLGAGGKDALELMQLLDANSDGSLSSDEFDAFQKQAEFMRSMEERDDNYEAMLERKLKITDTTGLIQVYSKELEDKLAVN